MANQTETFGIGVMSGTSLDGMDIAYCKFIKKNDNYSFEIIQAETVKYSKTWLTYLQSAQILTGENLSKLNVKFGKLIADNVNGFIQKNNINPSFIASHGHTVFHQPKDGFTLQIGSGAEISTNTNLKTICDFRTNDIALNGQGAPLVPIGDKLLFSEFETCINLGGFANTSYSNKKDRIAYDVCPVNIALNHYAGKLGLPYDANGEIARNNNINTELLIQLNKIPFYSTNPPKSLGREWIENVFFEIIDQFNISNQDKIATITKHSAIQIANSIRSNNVLFTGGGAYNSFLIETIQEYTKAKVIIPDNKIIEFKEALIFSFLGLLRINNDVNCLKSATGALRNNIGGCIYIP